MEFTSILTTIGWLLWQVLYILFWTWPLWYITWLATAVVAMSARTEYLKRGGGLWGLMHALWYAVKRMPNTMNHIFRWIGQQIVLIASIASKRDIMSDLPKPVLRWLGQTLVETKIIERDRVVYRDRWKKVSLKWRVARFSLTVLLGMALIRAYDYWAIVGPWIYRWF